MWYVCNDRIYITQAMMSLLALPLCPGTVKSFNKILKLTVIVLLFIRWLGMLMRSTVAAIDFNYNVGRKSKIGPDGKPRLRTKVIF